MTDCSTFTDPRILSTVGRIEEALRSMPEIDSRMAAHTIQQHDGYTFVSVKCVFKFQTT